MIYRSIQLNHAKASRVVCTPNTDYNYYMNEGSISHVKSVKNCSDMYDAFWGMHEYALSKRHDLISVTSSNLLHAAWKTRVSMGHKKDAAYLDNAGKMADFSRSVVKSDMYKKFSRTAKIKMRITSSATDFAFFEAKVMNSLSNIKNRGELFDR